MQCQRTRVSVLSVVCLTAALVGCGDDGTPGDAGMDSGVPDGGGDSGTVDSGADAADSSTPTDGSMDGGPDTSVPDGGGELTLRGTVYIEGAGDTVPDAGVTPWPDGGMPDGAMITPGGRVIGATVFVKTLAGETIASATTDALGEYFLNAPSDTLTFLQVDPVMGYAGSIRAEQTRGMDYQAYDMVLAEEAGLVSVSASAGVTRDPGKGLIACGFNPVDNDAGGEGAELGAAITHDSAFNITDADSIVGNRLVPLCDGAGANPPGALPGAVCTTDNRAKQVFFPNVVESLAPVTALDPLSGTCSVRFPVDEWLTAPGCLTVVNIDCAP